MVVVQGLTLQIKSFFQKSDESQIFLDAVLLPKIKMVNRLPDISSRNTQFSRMVEKY